MTKQHSYTHIIWDWNGTLFNDMDFCVSIINDMLAKRRLSTVSLEEYRTVFTFPVRTYYQQLGFDFQRESFEALSHEFIAAYEARRHACALHPDARPVLEHVIASGKRQSVLSAYSQEALVTLIHAFGLGHLFEHLVGLDNVYAHGKLEQGRQLLGALSHAPAEVLLVGDTLHDWNVAETLGTACVLVTHGHQAKGRLQQSGARVVDSLRELYTII